MPHSINDDPVFLSFEQHSIIADPQAVLGSDAGQSFHASSQIILHRFNLAQHSAGNLGGERVQITNGPGLEFDPLLHALSETPRTDSPNEHVAL